tara:strand:- start:756 stop:1052 length:297 start_codon:yes stop_codon:yes gene_type:complete
MTPMEAVKRYLDRKMLLDIKHGGEKSHDISPGGWMDEWNEMLDEMTDILDQQNYTKEDKARLAEALDINCWWGAYEGDPTEDPNYDPMDEDAELYQPR